MLLFGMSYISLQIFQLIGISHTHFLSYNPILSIKPRVIKELPNFTVIYGYDVIYLLNGLEYTAESLEFYVTVLVPGPMIPYSTTGKLLHNGRVSLDKVKTNTIYGVVLWGFAIIFLVELY